MKVSRFVIAISVVIIIFAGIWVSNVLGFWETSGSKGPRQFENGEFTGLNDLGDIRGSYTFGNIEDSFNIDSVLLAQAFGFESDNPSSIRLNELESFYEGLGFPVEIGTSSVKYFVALYAGLSIDEPEGLTIAAVNILKDYEKITETLYIDLMLVTVDLNGIYEITGTPRRARLSY